MKMHEKHNAAHTVGISNKYVCGEGGMPCACRTAFDVLPMSRLQPGGWHVQEASYLRYELNWRTGFPRKVGFERSDSCERAFTDNYGLGDAASNQILLSLSLSCAVKSFLDCRNTDVGIM